MKISKRHKILYPLICILMFASLQHVSGQFAQGAMNPDSVRMVELFDQARTLYAQGLNMEAMSNAESALQLAMGMDQEYYESRILELIGDIYRNIDEYDNSIPYYLRTANLLEMRKDTVRAARIFEKIALAYQFEKVHDKEFEYFQRAYNHLSADNVGEELRLREAMAFAAFNGRNMDRAVGLYRSLVSEYLPQSDDWLRARHYMVKIFDAKSQYDSALICCQELLTVYEKKGNVAQQFRLHNNIGYYQTLKENFRSASRSYIRAIETGRAIKADPREIGLIVTNAGICYQNMENMNESVLYFSQAIQIFDDSENYADKSRVENILATIYFQEGDLYNAGEFASRAIESAREANDPQRLSEAYLTYSMVLREGNDPINALENYENFLKIRDSLSLERKMAEQDLEQRRHILDKEERDLQLRLKEEEVSDLAIKQLRLQNEKIEQEKELLMNEKNLQLLEQEKLEQEKTIAVQKLEASEQEREQERLAAEIGRSEAQREMEAQKRKESEREILLLEKQGRLDQLELEKQEAAKKAVIWIAAAGFFVAIIILFSLISARKKNLQLAKQKTEIEEKNDDLELKNEEIKAQRDDIEAKNINLEQMNEEISTQRDEIEAQRNLVFEQKEAIEQINVEVMKSIEYARRIQSSTLPEKEAIQEHVSDTFVLYRPRDVVSGDFFWYANVEGKSVFAVADSTGHGVPGAFMSMMGVSILKEIVQKEYVTHPGVILRRMRKEIINTMGQKGISGEQRDGYDMALITIDHEEKMLDYAGAYNSLYLIRNKSLPAPDLDELKKQSTQEHGELMLYEIAADKMPIAHYDRMDKFVNKEFPVYEGDQIYMFTDGYADQFGGENNKKFMYKPFKTLLLKNANEAMDIQHKILNDTLTEWMSLTPQIDDICVMGVKI